MWVWRKLKPEVKTRADFRQAHAQARQYVWRPLTRLGKKLDRCGGEWLASDGSKVTAVTSKRRPCRAKTLKPLLQQIKDQIDPSLKALDEHDQVVSQVKNPAAAGLHENIAQ
jgi:hypothetical protein